jgi:hypothetical protein
MGGFSLLLPSAADRTYQMRRDHNITMIQDKRPCMRPLPAMTRSCVESVDGDGGGYWVKTTRTYGNDHTTMGDVVNNKQRNSCLKNDKELPLCYPKASYSYLRPSECTSPVKDTALFTRGDKIGGNWNRKG